MRTVPFGRDHFMTLGEKLRQARLERGMSQTQVAGNQITRNMLSQLENDLASPSVKTLEYLAEVLDVSIGWLLDEKKPWPGSGVTDRGRQLYREGRYQACLELLKSAEGDWSDEHGLLVCRSAVMCSEQAWRAGNFSVAEQNAELALHVESVYVGPEERSRAWILRCRCGLAKGTLSDAWIAEMQKQYQIMGMEAERHLLLAQYHLTGGRLQDAEQELWLVKASDLEKNGEYLLLRGSLAVQKEQFAEGIAWLTQAECHVASKFHQMEVYRLLELCYKAQEDYKMAYHYASLRLNQV